MGQPNNHLAGKFLPFPSQIPFYDMLIEGKIAVVAEVGEGGGEGEGEMS